MRVKIETNIKPVIKQFVKFQKVDIPNITRIAINETAVRVKELEQAGMKKHLHKPRKQTINALFVQFARKNKLEATITYRAWAQSFMKLQIFGGIRKVTNTAVPTVNAKLNQHGNIPGRRSGVVKGKDQFRAKLNGIYAVWERTQNGLKIIHRFETNPKYESFIQIYFHAGDIIQFQKYGYSKSRLLSYPSKPLSIKGLDIYNGYNLETTYNTFLYLFDKLKKGVYVSIKGNQLQTYLPFSNINYKNNFTYRVEGEVFKPGTYSIGKKNLTVRQALALAGGLTELTSERNLTVKQEFTELNEEGDKITSSNPVNNVNLDFEIGINSVIIASPFENVVRVEGNVYNPGLITYVKGAKLPRYIELAGGRKPDTLRNRIYIRRANGNIEQSGVITLALGKNVYPGDTIIVPVNPNPKEFDITAFISDLSTTLANIAAILLIVDNQTD